MVYIEIPRDGSPRGEEEEENERPDGGAKVSKRERESEVNGRETPRSGEIKRTSGCKNAIFAENEEKPRLPLSRFNGIRLFIAGCSCTACRPYSMNSLKRFRENMLRDALNFGMKNCYHCGGGKGGARNKKCCKWLPLSVCFDLNTFICG